MAKQTPQLHLSQHKSKLSLLVHWIEVIENQLKTKYNASVNNNVTRQS